MAARKGGPHPFGGIAGSVHIKKNTAGTSNEISLSVLDGLKSQADDRLGEADPKVKLGDLSLFTVPSKKERRLPGKDERRVTPQTASLGPASAAEKKAAPQAVSSARKRSGSSAPSGGKASRAQRNRERALKDPEKEIKRRKKNRRFRRFAMRACAVAACCACIAAGVVFAADLYEKHQSNLSLLSQAFDELEKADMLVLNMDDMVMEETVESSSSEDIDALDQGMDDAHVHLNAACAFADQAASEMGDSAGKDAAGQVEVSADARRDMMQYAEALLHADREAKDAVDAVEECWDFVVQADGLMKEAAELVSDTTEENVRASQGKSEEAIEALSQAQESLVRAQEGYPSADFSALSAFIEKKKEQNGYALASDDAIYIQDKATAESFNEKYNQADAEAIELARALPEKPAQPILDRLDAQTSQTRASYLDARKRAAESDAFIRDYLGQPGR